MPGVNMRSCGRLSIRSFLICCAAFPVVPLRAASIDFVSQNRKVFALGGNSIPIDGATDTKTAPDFAPFAGDAFVDFASPSDGDESIGHATQNSSLSSSLMTAQGLVSARVDDDFAEGTSTFEATFDVSKSSKYAFDLHLDFTEIDFLNDDPTMPFGLGASASLKQNTAGGDVSLFDKKYSAEFSGQTIDFNNSG